jgi:hypothetical protein
MCCLEGKLGYICFNTDVIVCFLGLEFGEHVRFPICRLGLRRMK